MEITQEDLRVEFRIASFGTRKRLMRAIEELKRSSNVTQLNVPVMAISAKTDETSRAPPVSDSQPLWDVQMFLGNVVEGREKVVPQVVDVAEDEAIFKARRSQPDGRAGTDLSEYAKDPHYLLHVQRLMHYKTQKLDQKDIQIIMKRRWDESAEETKIRYTECSNTHANVSTIGSIVTPYFSRILKPHQSKGVEFLWRVVSNHEKQTGAILAHTMGSGNIY